MEGFLEADPRVGGDAEGLLETDGEVGGDWRFAGAHGRQRSLFDLQMRRRPQRCESRRYPETRKQQEMADTHTIKITVDEETHRRACAEAEQRGLTVSELAAQAMAASLPHEDVDPDPSRDPTDRELRYRRFLEPVERIRADNPGFSAADNLPRDELYLERNFRR